jgi:alpha-mannosidase
MREYRDQVRSLAQLGDHLKVLAAELSAWERVARHPIAGWSATAPDAVARPISLGDGWRDRNGLHLFGCCLIRAPAAPDGTAVELLLDFGGEGMVTLAGADGAVLDRFGSNPHHRAFAPLPVLPFRIEAEVVARSLFGVPNRAPVFADAAFQIFDPAVRALRRRIEILRATALTVSDAGLARQMLEAGEIALSRLRLPTRTTDLGPRLADQGWARSIWERSFEPTDTPAPISSAGRQSVLAATVKLDALLAELRADYPKLGHVIVTGHAHIDYAWLWPQPETVRKIRRTFNSVASLMDKYPEFRFAASSSLMYEHIESDDPALFQRIKTRVAEGRWEVIGGMLIECDTNMPSAEAFARQFLYGQRYFKRHFGAISRTAWLPDTFGFSAVMPQILRQSGIDTLVTIKISWNETNPLPNTIFRWQGNDGSRVLVHCFNAYDNHGYNMLMRPEALAEVWAKHTAKDLSKSVIATYGWGDGGGGPSPDQIEALPILNLMPTIPRVEHGHFQSHFDQLHADLDGAAVPVWSGELYLEYHRATLTTQGRTKALNRRAEQALVAAEAMAVLARLATPDTVVAAPDLAADWSLLLRNQFHDILPGSSIREVYEQTEPELAGIVARGEAVVQRELQRLIASRPATKVANAVKAANGIIVANLSGTTKTAYQLHSPSPLPAGLAAQRTGDGWVTTIDQRLPPLSVSFASTACGTGVAVSGHVMENRLVRVSIDDEGRIGSLFVKASGRDLVSGAPAHRLMVYRNDLPRNFDAWDIEPGFTLGVEELLGGADITVTASGPHLAEITVRRTLASSTIETRYRLWANSPRCDIISDIDWRDRRTYLRAVFPVAVRAEMAQFDQAIGVANRATHDNTSWQQAQFESCGHRFVSISETDWGACLLSADRYGFSAKDNQLSLSLVRGPMYPDMLADEGHHRIRYALLPHDGRWWSPAVQAEADLVNEPLRFAAAPGEPGGPSGLGWPSGPSGTGGGHLSFAPISWQGQDFRFHALKPAEAGNGLILRVSESAGRSGSFDLTPPQGMIAQPVTILEEPAQTAQSTVPFQLFSWHLAAKD